MTRLYLFYLYGIMSSMSVVETVDITNEKQLLKNLESQFDLWVLILWNDDNLDIRIPIVALGQILKLDLDSIASLINTIEAEGKAPVASGSKEEMNGYAKRFNEFKLTTSVEPA